MKHRRNSLFLLALAAMLLAGCRTPGPYEPLDTTKYTIENTDKFVLLDQAAQVSVTCTGLQERILSDGRLEVVANVKNREHRRIQVQINCVFKNEQGFSAGDETPFRNLILAENSTEAVRFTSLNNLARKYTIRVREAR
ncbi:MAG: YcfL family protein [Opitutaceae bacterium]|nr:YcfL family protein [Opitutaceae bacterium]